MWKTLYVATTAEEARAITTRKPLKLLDTGELKKGDVGSGTLDLSMP